MSTVGSRARARMINRAVLERNSTSTSNAYGHKEAPSFSTLGDPIPCRIWTRARGDNRREINDTRKFAMEEKLFCSMPVGTDVTELDQVTEIQDRLGVVLYPGPFRIDTLRFRNTHLTLELRKIKSSASGA
ncbi:hypothetical protein LCGC14_0746930 [marine sediment metagenome]|uniref:Uncharacterized protein n=1 Tax=marine sediment metagenome TaxID=412755 RepID=A0A0F9QQ01_9ZZZZ